MATSEHRCSISFISWNRILLNDQIHLDFLVINNIQKLLNFDMEFAQKLSII